jgi:hypothetical protein
MIARIAGTVILSAIVFVVVIFGSVTYHMAHSDQPDSPDGSAPWRRPLSAGRGTLAQIVCSRTGAIFGCTLTSWMERVDQEIEKGVFGER